MLLGKPYQQGTHFTLRTYHDVLTWILTKTMTWKKLSRWRLRLVELYFTAEYRPGVNNQAYDALSRSSINGEDIAKLENDGAALFVSEYDSLCEVYGEWSDGSIEDPVGVVNVESDFFKTSSDIEISMTTNNRGKIRMKSC